MYVRCLQHEANVANSTATSPMAHSIRCQEDDQKVNWEAEEVIRRGNPCGEKPTTRAIDKPTAIWQRSHLLHGISLNSKQPETLFQKFCEALIIIIGPLSMKPRRWRLREHGKKNWFLMGRIKAQRVRFQTMYISQPSSAKQQRETSKICVVCGHKPR